VPETMSIRDFVKYSQRRHMHLSVVVDEYGGTEGLVTLDDALEEVVGEIRDAAKTNNKRYNRLAKGSYRVEGSLPLSDLSRILGIEIESPEHETVAGFFMERLKKIPKKGDQLEFAGLTFTVDEVDGKRVAALRVEERRLRQEQAS
jgi:CBS domain containing-hemolysin-like protein